jgi:hypothetical protein
LSQYRVLLFKQILFSPGSNIKNMLMNMPTKKKDKEADVKLDEDAVLGDILGKIKPKLPTGHRPKTAGVPPPLLSGKPAAAAVAARPSEERNPFLQRGTGLKRTVPAAATAAVSKHVDTAPSAAVVNGENDSEPSQVIEEFESCPMDGFDEEMIIDNPG